MLSHYLFLSGDNSPLYNQTLQTYCNSAAPGTLANRARQAKIFVTFALCYSVNYLFPSPLEAAMYVQFLANSHTSPSSLKNYVSGARHWILHHCGDPSSFSSPPVADVLKRLCSISSHIPAQAAPLSPRELRIICNYIDVNPSVPLSVKPCILISYACMLRASNVVSPSHTLWGGPHTIKAHDICFVPPGTLLVTIRSTKTTNRSKPFTLPIQAVSDISICPVRAWVSYVARTRLPPGGPAFLVEAKAPLTSSPVVCAIRTALGQAGYQDVMNYSLHSIRRGSAQLAAAMGASRTDIMKHGNWRSQQGIGYYIDSASTSVSTLLARGLASH